MTPAEKRRRTIIKKYGSFKRMLAKRDRRDLVLGGYNGGIQKTEKGFAKWEDGQLSKFAKKRERDIKGRFVAKTSESGEATDKDTEDAQDR